MVGFIDFSETQNNIYFFPEYCPGGNLEHHLRKHGNIPEKQALPLLHQLASGCAYLFDKNIYHRDLKTENILIGDNSTPLITQTSSNCQTSALQKWWLRRN